MCAGIGADSSKQETFYRDERERCSERGKSPPGNENGIKRPGDKDTTIKENPKNNLWGDRIRTQTENTDLIKGKFTGGQVSGTFRRNGLK